MLIFKKLFVYIFVVASTLTFATSCSKDEADSQPQQEFKVYVTTYAEAQNKKATNAPSNRAQVVVDGSYYDVKFADGDTLLVWGTTSNGKYFYGPLRLTSGSGSTSGTFSGTLNVETDGSDPLTNPNSINAILAPSNWKSKGYSFEESSHSYKHSTYVPVSSMTEIGPYLPIEKTAYENKTFTLDAQGCVIHVVWSGMKASQNYTIHTYDKSGDGKVDYCGGSMTSDETGKLDFYIPSTLSNGYYFVLNGEKEYIYDLTGTTTAITGQKIYRLKRTFLTNLSAQYTASDGDRFIGSTAYGIKIPDGATVTLENASVSQTATNLTYPAILCEGSATINLVGTNTLTSNTNNYSGIQPGGTDKTLTIQGSGSLTVTGGHSAAGIGAGGGTTCGNITIAGGTITATGGYNAAGIGAGSYVSVASRCGNITIEGGTITATGGSGGAGIGSGSMASQETSQCGKITISGGSVTATGGSGAASIGTGYASICGDITITSGATKIEMTRSDGEFNYPNFIGLGNGTQSTYCGVIKVDNMTSPIPITKSDYFTNFNSVYTDPYTWTLTRNSNP